ncbi:hypothetical protein OLK001_25640 [Synechocystis sp. LKSZ1]
MGACRADDPKSKVSRARLTQPISAFPEARVEKKPPRPRVLPSLETKTKNQKRWGLPNPKFEA